MATTEDYSGGVGGGELADCTHNNIEGGAPT